MSSTTNTADENAATTAAVTNHNAGVDSHEDGATVESQDLALTSGYDSANHSFLSVPLASDKHSLDENEKAHILRFFDLRKACKGLTRDMTELLVQLENFTHDHTVWRLLNPNRSLFLARWDVSHISPLTLGDLTDALDHDELISSNLSVGHNRYKDIVSLAHVTLKNAEEILKDADLLVMPDSHKEAKDAIHSLETELASFNRTANSLLRTAYLPDLEACQYFSALYNRAQD